VRSSLASRVSACLTLILAAGLLAASVGAQAVAARFRMPPPLPVSIIGSKVLSQEERAFIATLPAIRVGIPVPEARPYEVLGPDGEVTGIQAEMLAHIAQAFGLKITPVVLPNWTATLAAARSHEVDLILTLSVERSRQEYLNFTLGTTPLVGALFGRKGSGPPSPTASLDQAHFALERDYLQYPQARITTAADTGAALKALAVGEADVYLGSLFEAVDVLARLHIETVEVKELINFSSGYYHFGVRKDWPLLASILNKGIANLRNASLSELDSAVAALPSGLRPQVSLSLDEGERAALVRRPFWRIGAVRGLSMLNDVDDRGLHSGVAAEYSQQIAAKLGVSLDVVPFDNVAAMLDALRSGSIDLVPFLTRTEQRAAEFRFSVPYLDMPYVVVARSDAPLYWDLGSLRGKRLALALQHPLRELLQKRYPDIVVVDAANGTDAMNLVAEGRADAAVEVKLFANLRINGDNDGVLRGVAMVDELPAQFHFAASRAAAELIPLVDRALADISPAQRERMMRRWVAVDLAPGLPWHKYLPLIGVVFAALLLLATASAWWVRRLTREVRARRRADEQTRDIARNVPGVVWRYVVNAQGRMVSTFFSDSAEAFLGVQPVAGKTLLDQLGSRLPPDRLNAGLEAQSHSLRTGEPFRFASPYTHPDGRVLWLRGEAVSSQLESGATAWTGYLVDISSERSLQAELAQAVEAKNLFVATASHELRATTHTLALALAQALDTEPGGPQRKALGTAQDSAHTLQQLVNDVLDLASIDAGQLRLRPQDIDLAALVRRVAAHHEAAATKKGLRLTVEVDAGLPARLRLDPLRIEQVITNLLSNAIKYTDQGEVSLRLARLLAADGSGVLRLSFRDTGSGIPADQQARLFQPFATADRGAAASPVPEGSTGLGLVICRQLAGLMGGSIALDSVVGRGTEVHFQIPMPEPGAVQAAEPRAGVLLLCDDDAVSRMLLAEALSRHGHVVEEAADGQAALERWRRGDVGTVVTDLHMPRLGGGALVRAIRSEEGARLPRTCIVVCSGGSSDDSDAQAVHDADAAFLVKPVDGGRLLRTLAELGVQPSQPAVPAL
jgi:two-component system, NarL family, sensor histidine kinase EvgS